MTKRKIPRFPLKYDGDTPALWSRIVDTLDRNHIPKDDLLFRLIDAEHLRKTLRYGTDRYGLEEEPQETMAEYAAWECAPIDEDWTEAKLILSDGESANPALRHPRNKVEWKERKYWGEFKPYSEVITASTLRELETAVKHGNYDITGFCKLAVFDAPRLMVFDGRQFQQVNMHHDYAFLHPDRKPDSLVCYFSIKADDYTNPDIRYLLSSAKHSLF